MFLSILKKAIRKPLPGLPCLFSSETFSYDDMDVFILIYSREEKRSIRNDQVREYRHLVDSKLHCFQRYGMAVDLFFEFFLCNRICFEIDLEIAIKSFFQCFSKSFNS